MRVQPHKSCSFRAKRTQILQQMQHKNSRTYFFIVKKIMIFSKRSVRISKAMHKSPYAAPSSAPSQMREPTEQKAPTSSRPTEPSHAGCCSFNVLNTQSKDARGEHEFHPLKKA